MFPKAYFPKEYFADVYWPPLASPTPPTTGDRIYIFSGIDGALNVIVQRKNLGRAGLQRTL